MCLVPNRDLAFPQSVTRPGFTACLYWRWLPAVATRYHPSFSSIRITSLTLITGMVHPG